MDYQYKSREVLIKKLRELQQEFDSLKTSYEKDIIERIKADQDQVSLLAMLDITPGFVGFADARDTHILYINPSGRKMVGIGAHEDVTQLKIADVHPEWTNKLLREVSIPTAISEGMWTGECAFLHRDGREILVMMVLLAHKLPSGEIVRFSTVSMDITERKQAESRLRLTLEWYEAIFEGSRDAIFISDQNSRFVAVNNAAGDLTGYSQKQLLKMRISDIHELPDLDAYKMYHKRIFDGEEILSEAKILRSDGAKIDTEFNNRCVSIAGKLYMHTTARNITDRKQAREALHLEKENFRHSLDDSPLGVRITSAEGNTVYANQTILNFYGYDSLEELQNTPLKDRYTPESFAEAQKRKQQRERGDLSTNNYEIRIVRKDGEIRHLQVFRKEVLWDGVWQFQIIYDDITERRKAEEELRKSKELLENLNKHLFDIRENERALISREIHDELGQSLTALKLDVNLMYQYLSNIPEAVLKLVSMNNLISNTIKNVQRISSELHPGILDDLGLVSAIEWYCEEFEKRTAIKCYLKLDNSDYTDSRINLTFFRILQETLTNVIRHARASSVLVMLYQSQKGSTMTIKDNGIGMAEEKVHSHKSIGLNSIRERVKQFNGKIDVSSKTGEGTKLTIFLPS